MKVQGLAVVLLFTLNMASQSAPSALPFSDYSLSVELRKSVDAKKNKVGDPVIARFLSDVRTPSGNVIAPRAGSKLMGHVTTARAWSRDTRRSELGIVFDKIVLKNGREIPVSVTVIILEPRYRSLGNDNFTSVPTSGDDPVSRADGRNEHAPLSRNIPAPRERSAQPSRTITPAIPGPDGFLLTSDERTVRIEGETRIDIRMASPAK
jgi:hypothetical protein